MKKITIILVIMMFVGMIPAASAQTYEEAVANEKIIDELLREDFAFDAESGLWIYHANDSYSDDMAIIDAEYNMALNEGKMTVIHKTYNEEVKDFELSEEYTIVFKWYETEEQFSIVTMNVTAHKFINDLYF